MRDEMFLPGTTNLLESLEANVGMVAEAQERTANERDGENHIILRIGVAQNPPVQLTELAEISLSLKLYQAQELADLLRRFAAENEFPEESVRFEFKGDNSSEAFGALSAYVKRPHSSSVSLPVEARLARTGGASNEGAVTMALRAPKQDEDGVWHAEVFLTRSQAHLYAYMILVHLLKIELLEEVMRRKRSEKRAPKVPGERPSRS